MKRLTPRYATSAIALGFIFVVQPVQADVTVQTGTPVSTAAQYLPAYYGFIHAHTAYSIDYKGAKDETPDFAFAFARDVAGLDWMAVSDHSESFVGQTGDAHWEATARAAADSTEDGRFVAFRAFEYSNSFQGHLCVLDTESFTNWQTDPMLHQFYSWLDDHPEAVATFNHPGSPIELMQQEFYHFRYEPKAAPTIVGMEVISSGSRFEQRDRGYDGEVSFFDEAVLQGWWLAPVSGEDSHRANWGTTTDNRTGVLAEALTKDDLLAAFRARRVFASEDRNAYLSLDHGEHAMGSAVVVSGAQQLDVYFSDPDSGERWTAMSVYQNGVIVSEEPLSFAGAGTARIDVPAPVSTDYYYVRVEQQDGERVQSAPIWLTRSATATVAADF